MSMDAKERRTPVVTRFNGSGPSLYNRLSDKTRAIGSSGKVRGEP